MKILLFSHFFAPSVGGIETVSRILAGQWSRMGHEVIVATNTAAAEPEAFEYRVIRRPGLGALFGLVRWADVYFQNNIALRDRGS